jgi:phage tail-like protein
MATGDRKDPYRGYNFRLEIDGIVQAGFHECTGLEEKDSSVAAIKVSGSHKVGDVTLKRGVIGDLSLLEWLKESAGGKTQRKNGSIILMDERHVEKTRWNFVGGWPTKWVGPSLNAAANDVAIETLEIVHEGLTKA